MRRYAEHASHVTLRGEPRQVGPAYERLERAEAEIRAAVAACPLVDAWAYRDIQAALEFSIDSADGEPLAVELPTGLALGATGIQIPADNPLTRAKIELGRQLYFDPRLSADGSVSCASCHHPDEGYARNTTFGVGIGEQTGNRNSPTSYNRILSAAQFWDGRAASLEEQAG